MGSEKSGERDGRSGGKMAKSEGGRKDRLRKRLVGKERERGGGEGKLCSFTAEYPYLYPRPPTRHFECL